MIRNPKIIIKKTINYSEQSIDKKDVRSVEKVLFSKSISQGPVTAKFENKLKNYFGAKYVNCLSSGTAALHLIGKALKWKKGDKIITTPNTFVATANAICYSGADPLFVDIDKMSIIIAKILLPQPQKHAFNLRHKLITNCLKKY